MIIEIEIFKNLYLKIKPLPIGKVAFVVSENKKADRKENRQFPVFVETLFNFLIFDAPNLACFSSDLKLIYIEDINKI